MYETSLLSICGTCSTSQFSDNCLEKLLSNWDVEQEESDSSHIFVISFPTFPDFMSRDKEAYIRRRKHGNLRMLRCVSTRTHTHKYTHRRIHPQTRARARACARAHTHTHAHTYARTHARTYARTHTHTHAQRSFSDRQAQISWLVLPTEEQQTIKQTNKQTNKQTKNRKFDEQRPT